MIRVSLSGAVWIEDVPGQELVLATPPDSCAYYEDNQEDLEALDGRPNLLGDEGSTGSRFQIERVGEGIHVSVSGCYPTVKIIVTDPNTVLVYNDEEGKWAEVDARDAPRTIDRRRTLWQRIRGDE